jgi:hypothetical protein
LDPNDYLSSATAEEGAPAICETTFKDCSDSNGGKSIGCRRGDRSKQPTSTSRRFERVSNVTDVSDMQLEKQNLHTTSTDAGISIVIKPLHANAYSSICCNFEFDSNVTDVSDLQ